MKMLHLFIKYVIYFVLCMFLLEDFENSKLKFDAKQNLTVTTIKLKI